MSLNALSWRPLDQYTMQRNTTLVVLLSHPPIRRACLAWRASSFGSQRFRFSTTSLRQDDRIPPLVGTAAEMERHLLIHTNHPATTWPSHLESTSALYKQLGQRWAKHARLSKLGFGMTDAAVSKENKAKNWDKERSRFEEPPQDSNEETYPVTIYPDFINTSISLSSLSDFEEFYLSLRTNSEQFPTLASNSSPPISHIFVCTHGSRDCRCRDIGEPLYQSLVRETTRRKLGGPLDPNSSWKESEPQIQVARVSHIGGHKFAGNALVYTKGGAAEWYGLLRAEDASTLIDHVTRGDVWWSKWRGRVGKSKSEMQQIFLEASQNNPSETRKKERVQQALGDPVTVIFKSWDGHEEFTCRGFEGESLMQVAKRADLESILATCGGACECATCHVHIPPLTESTNEQTQPSRSSEGRVLASVPAPALPLDLPALSDEEDEQLDFALGRKDDSRLSCQIPVTTELGAWCERGGRIGLPRY